MAEIQNKTDFNGDGYSDLAVGVPEENVGTVDNAGIVNVIYGSSGGLSSDTSLPDQVWSQSSAGIEGNIEQFDVFGSALAIGDFNGDGYSDLAVGVPGESIGNKIGAGGVNVIYGSSFGLLATVAADGTGRADQFWSQDSPNVEDDAETSEHFGSKLAAGDFNNDGYFDLVIGVPFESINGVAAVGAINVVYGSSEGLSGTVALGDGTGRDDQFWTQDSPDVEGKAGDNDQLPSSLAAGDFNNDGYHDLAIGVEVDDDIDEAGSVNVIYGSPSGLSATFVSDQLWTQDSPGVDGESEPIDQFGASLASGDFNNDGHADLAVGVVGEDILTVENAGAVSVLYGSSEGLSASASGDGTGRTDQLWHQDSPNLDDKAEPFDSFGSSLAIGDYNNDGNDDLVIGIKGEDIGTKANAGVAAAIYGSDSANGLSATATRPDQLWSQNSAGIGDSSEKEDLFGSSLA